MYLCQKFVETFKACFAVLQNSKKLKAEWEDGILVLLNKYFQQKINRTIKKEEKICFDRCR